MDESIFEQGEEARQCCRADTWSFHVIPWQYESCRMKPTSEPAQHLKLQNFKAQTVGNSGISTVGG